MTELKIKQADINNNGNQRLMGDFCVGVWGVVTQNMDHALKIWSGSVRLGMRLHFFYFFCFPSDLNFFS